MDKFWKKMAAKIAIKMFICLIWDFVLTNLEAQFKAMHKTS